MIASMGEGVCFLLNGVSYLFVIGSLIAMKITRKEMEKSNIHVLQEVREGFFYAFGFAPIKLILLLLALTSLVGIPYRVMMPVFARDILQGGPHTLGFLMGGAGVGALAGSVYLASRKGVPGLEKWIALAAGLFGIGLVGFSHSHVFWLSLVLVLLTGFGMMVQMASSNTVLQTVVEEDKRGRVMSLYAMAIRGMAPFGSLLVGGAASKIGAPNTLMISGLLCILGSTLFAKKLPVLQEMVRPIYARTGVLSGTTSTLQN
jgi:MFS family permease